MIEIYYTLAIIFGIALTVVSIALAIRIVSSKEPLIRVTNIRTTHVHKSETQK